MTNKEWINSLNAEQFATLLNSREFNKNKDRTTFIEWLEQECDERYNTNLLTGVDPAAVMFRGFHPTGEKLASCYCCYIKTKDKVIRGYWVYGDRVCLNGKIYIHLQTSVSESEIVTYNNLYEVVPETVGQKVAIDKKENSVFVGDKFWLDGYSENYVVDSMESFYRGNYPSDEIERYSTIWDCQ